MIPERVSLNDCPIGVKLHKPHTWRGGLFWGTVYGCDGVDEELMTRFELLHAGSKGTLTKEMVDDYFKRFVDNRFENPNG